MYQSTDHQVKIDYPRNSSITESNWHILASFWHPVAFSHEVTDEPFASKLLDIELMVYRTNQGVTVARDLCIHCGAKLGLGWIDEQKDNIVCPFHGLHYNQEGKCTKIPALQDQSKTIPSKMCLINYQAVEQYGIIWACLNPEASRPLPEWELLENHGDDWIHFPIPKGNWKASESSCENFNDIPHLSWVHMKTFGSRNRPEVPDYKLEHTDYGLHMEFPYIEVERGFNDEEGERKRGLLCS